MNQQEIIEYCDDFLNISVFKDYCPNGLQVEGDQRQVRRIALGVSISLEFIEKAIQRKADMIVTHHGLIWDKDDRIIRGPFKRKIQALLESKLAAAAYHLPLDFHPEVGNNIQLARKIGLDRVQEFAKNPNYAEGIMGSVDKVGIQGFSLHIENILNRSPTVLPYGKGEISKVAVATGGAQFFFSEAIAAGADCFITGEISEKNFSMSKEHGVHFISAGHYATEKFGIQALGKHLHERFDVACDFIDIHNPI
ncbi:MAG: Nif3-like dinuclear metal center hexameric protein [Proteobacteria bacterium]|nr:Nif3-like dinuclear metal center hexameric protein [Pseudomonadota bacterium]